MVKVKTISQCGELKLIDWLRRQCFCSQEVKMGIGDDTAVLPLSAKEDMLLTTDMSVEGIHFTRKTPPELIGRKALARNVSDIAAMGGTPAYAVVSLGLPGTMSIGFIQKVFQGIHKLAKVFHVSIVGGDTVKSETLIISVSLMGKVAKGKAVLRSGAQVGDQIFVTGPLGGSLKSGRHLTFTPRAREAKAISQKYRPTAMIDISDGLAGDLGHILKESQVGAILEADNIPLHRGAGLKAGLYDGEDFELLFTLPKRNTRSGKPYFMIGTITNDKNRLYLRDKSGRIRLIQADGFTHF